jgi:orotate phosphoribosyltransferase
MARWRTICEVSGIPHLEGNLRPQTRVNVMTDSETKLRQLLIDRALKFGDFTLASGDRSSYYIDGRMVEVFSKSARLVGEVLYDRLTGLGVEFGAIGGLEVGAVPLTTAAVIQYDLRGGSMEGFWVRDAAKHHGTKKLIEGSLLRQGTRVVILDDVVTKGMSAVKAVETVRAVGCEVVAVVALVDRLVGAAELFKEKGIERYEAVFTIRDLGVKSNVGDRAEATPV